MSTATNDRVKAAKALLDDSSKRATKAEAKRSSAASAAAKAQAKLVAVDQKAADFAASNSEKDNPHVDAQVRADKEVSNAQRAHDAATAAHKAVLGEVASHEQRLADLQRQLETEQLEGEVLGPAFAGEVGQAAEELLDALLKADAAFKRIQSALRDDKAKCDTLSQMGRHTTPRDATGPNAAFAGALRKRGAGSQVAPFRFTDALALQMHPGPAPLQALQQLVTTAFDPAYVDGGASLDHVVAAGRFRNAQEKYASEMAEAKPLPPHLEGTVSLPPKVVYPGAPAGWKPPTSPFVGSRR